MRIAIFGATGGIGTYAVQHALKKGYEVNAYVRDPAKFTISHQNLNRYKGEINDYNNINKVLHNCDAVIWCVGIPMKKYEGTPSLDGHKLLFKAMKESNITRFIDWSTPSVSFHKDTKSFITVVPGILAGIAFNQSKQELLAIGELILSSDLKWTIVRFMAPKNTPYTGHVKVGFGDKKMNFQISREDIGAFMVEQVENEQYIGSMPIIGS